MERRQPVRASRRDRTSSATSQWRDAGGAVKPLLNPGALGTFWIIPFCTVVLLLLIALATLSTVAAIAAVGLAAILTVIVSLDLRRAGTLFLTIALFLAPLNDIRLGSSYVTASDLALALGIAVLAPTVLGRRLEAPVLFVLGLFILGTMGLIASIASPIPVVSFNQVARLLLGAFVLPIFFMIWRPSSQLVARFAAAYILGCVLSVGYGLLQGPVAGDQRYIGFTYHPNYLGMSCLLGASVTPFVVAKVAPQYRWIFWGSSLVCAYGVWISGSRAALVVLIMLVLVYIFVERSIRAGGAVALGLAGVLIFSGRLLQDDGNSALGRLLGNGTASGSDIQRKQILTEAWQQFKEHPLLGNGFDGGIGSHNIYLQVAVAVGVFGLLGYLLIMWTALRPLFWPGVNHRLSYPVLAYIAIGPLTNTLWDRLIWTVLALTFAVNLRRPEPPGVDEASEPLPIEEGT